MKLYIVVGARPNFVKIAPLIRTLDKHKDIEYKIIHTGQHYDHEMSAAFFDELEIPRPDVNFGMKTATHTSAGLMMSMFEEYCLRDEPDVVLVAGDVDSTRAIAIVVARMDGNIKLAHVEAGMRSGEHDLPEEMNRKITDILSDYCFCTTEDACSNCLKEGIDKSKIFLVGDTMIEQLYYALPLIGAGLDPSQKPYVFVTLHRNYNVDSVQRLSDTLNELNTIAGDIKVIFPIHPRTKQRIHSFGLEGGLNLLDIREPFGYLETLKYMQDASLVITDSGGMQVETTVLGVPCLTVRKATEHRYTLRHGTNQLVEPLNLSQEAHSILSDWTARSHATSYTGEASKNIIEILRPT